MRVLTHADMCGLLWDEVAVLDQFPGDVARMEMWLMELDGLQKLME